MGMDGTRNPNVRPIKYARIYSILKKEKSSTRPKKPISSCSSIFSVFILHKDHSKTF